MPYFARIFRWCILLIALVLLGCGASGENSSPKVVEVTKIIPVTEIVKVTKIVRVTRIVPVTQIIPVTGGEALPPAVPVPAPTARATPPEFPPTEMPAVTEAPTEFELPPTPVAPTEVPPTVTLVNDVVLVYYDFESDFIDSGVVTDSSGNGFDARVVGTVDQVSGILGGRAIRFGGNGFVQAQANPAAGLKNVSFSLWFRTKYPENNYAFASAAWWSGGPGSGWILATYMPEFWSEDTNSLYLPGLSNFDNDFPVNEWIHEVITYDGERLKEYTNGSLVNNWRTTGAAIGPGSLMTLGGWPPFYGYNFHGDIDEFEILGWALSEQEIQGLYYQGR